MSSRVYHCIVKLYLFYLFNYLYLCVGFGSELEGSKHEQIPE